MESNKVSWWGWMSILCYGVIISGGILFGLQYLLNPSLLAYHLNALGVSSMGEITESSTLMLLTFKRAAGLGFLCNAASMVILLICQTIKRYKWAIWALFIMTLLFWLMLFFNVNNLERNTNAGAPALANLLVALLSIPGLLAAMADRKKGVV